MAKLGSNYLSWLSAYHFYIIYIVSNTKYFSIYSILCGLQGQQFKKKKKFILIELQPIIPSYFNNAFKKKN